jgi:hypothetical protein
MPAFGRIPGRVAPATSEAGTGNITAFLNGLQSQMIVTPNPLAAAGSDADDIVFIEAALATTDRTIVTGNLADYPPEFCTACAC